MWGKWARGVSGWWLHPSSCHTCLDNRAASGVLTRLADIPSNIKMQGPKKVVSEAPRFEEHGFENKERQHMQRVCLFSCTQ